MKKKALLLSILLIPFLSGCDNLFVVDVSESFSIPTTESISSETENIPSEMN